MPTYTYDPSEIRDGGVSQARFELGDIQVEGESESCYLCDEEIQAVLDSTPSRKQALYLLADAVCIRLSYETSWKNDQTAFNLSERADRWIALRDRFKKAADAEACMPSSGAVRDSIQGSDGGHYFHRGMHKSPYVQPPYPLYEEGDP